MKSSLALILSIIIIIGVLCGNYFVSKTIYNNGICMECGGHYHIVGTPTKNYHFYVYECNQCGDSFRTITMMHKSK